MLAPVASDAPLSSALLDGSAAVLRTEDGRASDVAFAVAPKVPAVVPEPVVVREPSEVVFPLEPVFLGAGVFFWARRRRRAAEARREG